MASFVDVLTHHRIFSMSHEELKGIKTSILENHSILSKIQSATSPLTGLPFIGHQEFLFHAKEQLVSRPSLLAAKKTDDLSTLQLSSMDITSRPRFITKIRENNRKIQNLLDEIAEREVDPQRLSLAVAEVLSKGLAYSRTLDNRDYEFHFEIPQIVEGRIIKIHYVASAWDLGNSNLAYILEPYPSLVAGKSAKCGVPFVIFRGTCPHEFGTVRSSFGVHGILSLLTNETVGFGSIVVEENRKAFQKVIIGLREQHGLKPMVVGHSLGGALAQRLSVVDGNLEHVSGVMAFNSPGILREDLDLWDQHLLENPEDTNKIICISTDKDPVNFLGFSNFIGKKYLFKPDESLASKGACHGQVILTKAGQLTECPKKVISLAQKVFEIAIFPIRLSAVLILAILAFITVDVLGMAYFLLTSDEVSRRSLVERVSVHSDIPVLDQIRDRSPVFWSSSPQGSSSPRLEQKESRIIN